MERYRFCIFCGELPDKKTKEHVLPQWLIELTGSPKRVVNFGVNPFNGSQPRFDWSSFVFPACSSCNQQYSNLESNIKKIIESILEGYTASAYDYIQLFDWLDKVRIGLWLGYFYLHKNPIRISPTFHINSRIGQKDRMVAIYTIDTKSKGLNAIGAETPLFQLQPSCFSLNINHLHILNISSDCFCSARCGFPFPRQMGINLDQNGFLECSDYDITHKIKHPIIRNSIIKPTIHIYQPILQEPISKGKYNQDNWLRNMLVDGSGRQGALIRQYDTNIEVIKDQNLHLEYDEVTGLQCKPLKEIMAQTYNLQIKLLNTIRYNSSDSTKFQKVKQMKKSLKMINTIYRDAFKNAK